MKPEGNTITISVGLILDMVPLRPAAELIQLVEVVALIADDRPREPPS